MTNSDREESEQQAAQGNPFDTGLPMLRTPTGKSNKTGKRRRKPARRKPPHREPPPVAVEQPTTPAATTRPSAKPVPHPAVSDQPFDLPAEPTGGGRPADRSDSWEQWLEPEPQARHTPDASGPDLSEYVAAASDSEQVPVTPAAAADDYETHAPALVNRSGLQPGTPLRHPRRQAERGRSNKPLGILIGVGIVVAAVAIVLAVGSVLGNGEGSQAAAPTPGNTRLPDAAGLPTSRTSTAAPAATAATAGCEQKRTAQEVSGTAPGGTANGADAILAFEYAYYVQRSGYRAREVVAEDASVSPAEQIQRGINQLPLDTRYCVRITRAGTSQDDWEVQLTQQLPNEDPQTFTQIVTTRSTTDQTLITAIKGA